MQNLRDQLLKSGLANKQQKQQVEQEKRRQRKRHKKGQVEDAALEQQRQAYEARLDAQRAADRQRAAVQRAELEAKEKWLRLQHLIDYWQLPDEPGGNRRWYFTTQHQTISYLYVTEPTANRLTAGDVAIVERPDTEERRYVLVEREAAEYMAPIDPVYIRFSNRELLATTGAE